MTTEQARPGLSVRNDCNTLEVTRAGKRTQSLDITFKRTVRVADGKQPNALPPDLGEFPIYTSSKYDGKLPKHMDKDGFFMPMYQREAMWLNFESTHPFAIKIHVGGVNAISGEPALEDMSVMLRRLKLLDEKKCIQDYIVIPDQLWLDGIATTDGNVRQFVAMPLGTGYSVECQLTGDEMVGGLQFEITPSIPPAPMRPSKIHPEADYFDMSIKSLKGRELEAYVANKHTIDDVKVMISDHTGLPPDQQRLIFRGKQLEDGRSLEEYDVPHGATLHLVERLRGGGGPEMPEMGIAAGGLIKQTIERDNHHPTIWDPQNTIRFNVAILNSNIFKQVTEKDPPPCPVTARTYKEHGFPYFDLFEEKASGVVGEFEGVKSVNDLDKTGTSTESKKRAADEIENAENKHVVTVDRTGKRVGFRTRMQLESEVRKLRKEVSSLKLEDDARDDRSHRIQKVEST